MQCKKKLMANSPGLGDVILHLPNRLAKVLGEFFEEINLIHCTCKNLFGLVKVTSGLAYPIYSLPDGHV